MTEEQIWIASAILAFIFWMIVLYIIARIIRSIIRWFLR